MTSFAARVTMACAAALVISIATPAHAEPREEAREQFAAGAELVKAAKWSEALTSFERSFALVPHPVTLFNVGACERALGSYARARRTFLRTREIDRAANNGTL